MREQALFESGMKVRREIIGAQYVDKAVGSDADFDRHRQEYVTKPAGEVFAEPTI